jgi:hypothetical protein
MKCDECGKMEMIDMKSDVYSVDGATHGWIILNINQPLEDNYTYRPPRRSDVTAVADICTLQCARTYLRNCLPDDSEAQQ